MKISGKTKVKDRDGHSKQQDVSLRRFVVHCLCLNIFNLLAISSTDTSRKQCLANTEYGDSPYQ